MSSENRFCDQCGKAVPTLDSQFCPFCGSQMSAAKDKPPAVTSKKGKSFRWAKIVVAVSLVLFIVVLLAPSGGQENGSAAEFPPDAIHAISAIGEDNEFITVRNVEAKPHGTLTVTLAINHVPGFTDSLDDFYLVSETWTKAIAQDTVKLLEGYDIDDMDLDWIIVRGWWVTSEDQIVILGSTRYDMRRQSYKWERFVP